MQLVYRRDLQGLRAFAILLVVCSHAGLPLLPGGFVGVDVFFVLSGYLITGLLMREHELYGRISLARFYARRLKRLLPALIVMLGISSVAAWYLLSSEEARAQTGSAPFAATWTSNFHFAFRENGYFEELAEHDLFVHTWSLSVEEQFYLVWPLLVLLLLAIARDPRSADPKKNILAALGLVALASMGLSLYWMSNAPFAAFYMMPARAWQFALGAAISVALTNGAMQRSAASPWAKHAGRLAPALLWFGLMLIVGSAIWLDSQIPYPGLWAILPSLGAALVIGSGCYYDPTKSPLGSALLVWIGDRSYSWYLWHWPVLVLGFSLGFEGRPLAVLALVLFSLLAAAVTYRLVELPVWKGRFSNSSSWQYLASGVAAMAVVVAVSISLQKPIPKTEDHADFARLWSLDLPPVYPMGCDAWYRHARLEPCVFGPTDAPQTAVLVGDSIGTQWFSVLPLIFRSPEWRVVVLTKSACAMVDVDYFYERIGKQYQICTEWRNSVLEELERIQPDVVFLGSSASYGFSEEKWIGGSARIFERVSASAGHVAVISGTPSLGFDGPSCMSRRAAQGPDPELRACTASDRMGAPRAVTAYLQVAASGFKNVQILDLNDLVCPNDICQAVDASGTPVFRDSQHLTDSFVRSQAEIVQQRLGFPSSATGSTGL